MIEAIVYLLAITSAELVTVFGNPLWGMAIHAVIMVLLLVHWSVGPRYPHRPLLLSLALVPLVRIISLTMPLTNIPQIWWYLVVYIPLLGAAIVVIYLRSEEVAICPYCGQKTKGGVCQYCHYQIQRLTELREVGLSFGFVPVQLLVGLSGIVFGVAEYFILAPEAVIPELSWQAAWLPALMFLLCTGFVEEFIFRGVLQCSAVDAFGWWGIVYVSLLFAVLHLGFLSWVDVVFVFFVALFFGWVVKKTGSLLGVTLSHSLTNILLYLVIPFLANPVTPQFSPLL